MTKKCLCFSDLVVLFCMAQHTILDTRLNFSSKDKNSNYEVEKYNYQSASLVHFFVELVDVSHEEKQGERQPPNKILVLNKSLLIWWIGELHWVAEWICVLYPLIICWCKGKNIKIKVMKCEKIFMPLLKVLVFSGVFWNDECWKRRQIITADYLSKYSDQNFLLKVSEVKLDVLYFIYRIEAHLMHLSCISRFTSKGFILFHHM